MVKPVDPRQRKRIVHPDDEDLPTEEQTGWFIRVPTALEQKWIDDEGQAFIDDPRTNQPQLVSYAGTRRWKRVKICLCAVENFDAKWTDEPNPVERPNGQMVPTSDFLNRIPAHVRDWIADRAAEHGMVSEDEAGKSSGPSTPDGEALPATAPSAVDAAQPTAD